MLLETLLKLPENSPQLHLRSEVYGRSGIPTLVREIMGMANADAGRGARYILIGVTRNAEGQLEFKGLNRKALAEFQQYPAQVLKYLEPDLKISSSIADLQGHMVGVLEISQAVNPPYLLKLDAARDLQRGACWTLEGGLFRPAQRADLDRMFSYAVKMAGMNTDNNIVRVGLGEDPNLKAGRFSIPDKSNPPSQVAAERIKNEIEAKKVAVQNDIEDTQIGRLVHARLYGNESDFTNQGVDTLVEEYNVVMDRFNSHDNYYFYETQAIKLNLTVVNTGHKLLEDISVMLMLPWGEQFRVSDRLQPKPGKTRSVKESELLGYPKVKVYDKAVQVKCSIPELLPDQVTKAFGHDLRISVHPALAGKKIRVRYSVHARGLEQPETGELNLIFTK